MSSARKSRGDDAGDGDLAQQREERKREREERRKQRDSEASNSEADRKKQREERRKKKDSGEDTESSKTKRQVEPPKKTVVVVEQEEEEEEEQEEVKVPTKVSVSIPADKTDSGPQTAFDKIGDDRKRRIIDQLIDRLYELAEERDAKNKPAARPSADGTVVDASALDLKVKSLRTRVRNAENATQTLAKQQKDIEQKIKVNHSEVERLRKECVNAEAEYNDALKNGAVVVEAGPKRGRGAGGGKGAGFFDVVKKAQSALWEDKFRAFKEKQKSTTEQPAWVNNLKKSDSHSIGATVIKTDKKKEEKASWQNQTKVHKVVLDPRAKKEAEPTGAKKPAWSGVSLKKAEKK